MIIMSRSFAPQSSSLSRKDMERACAFNSQTKQNTVASPWSTCSQRNRARGEPVRSSSTSARRGRNCHILELASADWSLRMRAELKFKLMHMLTLMFCACVAVVFDFEFSSGVQLP